MTTERAVHLLLVQSLQVAIVVTLIGAIAGPIVRRRPHLAYALWLVALAKCIVPPVWDSPTGVFSWAGAQRPVSTIIAHEQQAISLRAPASAAPGIILEGGSAVMVPSPSLTKPAVTRRVDWFRLLIAGWAAVAGLSIAISSLLAAVLRHRAWRLCTAPPDAILAIAASICQAMGLRRAPEIWITGLNIGPAVLGTFRPVVVLPRRLLAIDAPSMRAVLGHEFAHIRRRDPLIAALQRLVVALYWFHPLVWWMSARMSAIREQCCDEETVAGLAADPVVYAQTLLSVAGQGRLGSLLGVHAMQVTIRRLQKVMDERACFHRCAPRSVWVIALLAAMLLLPGAGRLLVPALADNALVAVASNYPAITGIVTDKKTGKPLADATVTIDWATVSDAAAKAAEYTPKPLNVRSIFKTGNDGKYEILVPAAAANAPRLKANFTVHRKGYGQTWVEFFGMTRLAEIQRNAPAKPAIETAMMPCIQLTGIIAGPDHSGVAGVKVRVTSRPRSGWDPGVVDESVTDADGHFVLDVLQLPRCHTTLEVFPDKFASVRQDVSGRWNAGVITLSRGISINGSVTGRDGEPLAGSVVQVMQLDGGDNFDARDATVDGDGKFNLLPLAAGKYELTVYGGKQAESFLPVAVTVPASGSVPPIEFKPAATAKIIVHSIDEAGHPIKTLHYMFFAKYQGASVFRQSRRIADDAVEIEAPVGAETAQIGLNTLNEEDEKTVGRYRMGNGPVIIRDTIDLGTIKGDITDVTVIRVPRAKLIVTVVPPDGMPLMGQWVRPQYIDHGDTTNADHSAGGHQSSIYCSDLDKPDEFSAPDIQPDQPFTMTVTAERCEPVVQQLTLARGETRKITVALKRAAQNH